MSQITKNILMIRPSCFGYNYETSLDNYFQKKNRSYNRSFKLDYFNISSPIADQKYKYDNYLRHILRKLLTI